VETEGWGRNIEDIWFVYYKEDCQIRNDDIGLPFTF
jgi:hypothetical protein